jgi:hypothetical protein
MREEGPKIKFQGGGAPEARKADLCACACACARLCEQEESQGAAAGRKESNRTGAEEPEIQ